MPWPAQSSNHHQLVPLVLPIAMIQQPLWYEGLFLMPFGLSHQIKERGIKMKLCVSANYRVTRWAPSQYLMLGSRHREGSTVCSSIPEPPPSLPAPTHTQHNPYYSLLSAISPANTLAINKHFRLTPLVKNIDPTACRAIQQP